MQIKAFGQRLVMFFPLFQPVAVGRIFVARFLQLLRRIIFLLNARAGFSRSNC